MENEKKYSEETLEFMKKKAEEQDIKADLIEKWLQNKYDAYIKSVKKEKKDIQIKKAIRDMSLEVKKRKILITMCAVMAIVSSISVAHTSINESLSNNELDHVDNVTGFSQNVDIAQMNEDQNDNYVALKYVDDIITYDANETINKDIYYDEMILYIFVHNHDVLDDVFRHLSQYAYSNKVSEEFRKAFDYPSFKSYLLAHNFKDENDFYKQINKIAIEKGKENPNMEKVQEIAEEHIDIEDNKYMGGRV